MVQREIVKAARRPSDPVDYLMRNRKKKIATYWTIEGVENADVYEYDGFKESGERDQVG